MALAFVENTNYAYYPSRAYKALRPSQPTPVALPPGPRPPSTASRGTHLPGAAFDSNARLPESHSTN